MKKISGERLNEVYVGMLRFWKWIIMGIMVLLGVIVGCKKAEKDSPTEYMPPWDYSEDKKSLTVPVPKYMSPPEYFKDKAPMYMPPEEYFEDKKK